MVINQGDLIWANLGPTRDSTPAGTRPIVVVQSDQFNQSQLATVVGVALTTSRRRMSTPGNVRFTRGEANLPKACAANVTHIVTLDRRRLLEKIGTVSAEKLAAVMDGIDLVLGMT